MNEATAKVELTKDELSALFGLMDEGIKAVGINCVPQAAVLIVKLNKAIEVAEEKEKHNGKKNKLAGVK